MFTGPLQIGDLSFQNGGLFIWPGNTIKDHCSHQNGLDADLRYVLIDRRTASLHVVDDSEHWGVFATVNVFMGFVDAFDDIDVIYADPVIVEQAQVYIEDEEGNRIPVLTPLDDGNHLNHFHVRINNPNSE